MGWLVRGLGGAALAVVALGACTTKEAADDDGAGGQGGEARNLPQANSKMSPSRAAS